MVLNGQAFETQIKRSIQGSSRQVEVDSQRGFTVLLNSWRNIGEESVTFRQSMPLTTKTSKPLWIKLGLLFCIHVMLRGVSTCASVLASASSIDSVLFQLCVSTSARVTLLSVKSLNQSASALARMRMHMWIHPFKLLVGGILRVSLKLHRPTDFNFCHIVRYSYHRLNAINYLTLI